MESGTCIPKRAMGLLERDIGDAVVVMTETGKVLHTLQGTALSIWRLIDGNNSNDMILRGLMAEYDVEKPQAETDLNNYLHALIENNLIDCNETK